jgi:hypothetical protein
MNRKGFSCSSHCSPVVSTPCQCNSARGCRHAVMGLHRLRRLNGAPVATSSSCLSPQLRESKKREQAGIESEREAKAAARTVDTRGREVGLVEKAARHRG